MTSCGTFRRRIRLKKNRTKKKNVWSVSQYLVSKKKYIKQENFGKKEKENEKDEKKKRTREVWGGEEERRRRKEGMAA